MEEQIEEGDVLGTEAWNGEYDIAEEEEERLLEEQDDTTDQVGEQTYFDGEYEASEVEEDVLDIGLNDDIIEFEEQEVSRISPVVSKANSGTPQQQISIGSNQQPAGNQSSANITAQSSGIAKGKEEPRYVQQVLPRKHFSPRHPGFTPRNGIPNSQFQHRPNFGNRPPHRPSFNNQHPPFVGRKPSHMDMRGVPNAFMGRSPFEEDHHPFPRSFNMQNNPPVNMLNQQHFLDPPDRGNNRCFINPHYKGSVMNPQGPPPQQSQRIPPGPDFGPFAQSMNKGPPQPPLSLFRPGPPNPPLNPPNQLRTRMPNVRFPPPINVPPPQSTGPRGPTNSMTSRAPSTSSAPPQLMDVILVPPGFRNDTGPPFFGERPPRTARFRFDSFPQQALHQPDHHEPLGPPPRSFLAPPPAAHPPIKRPHPVIELPAAGIPFKQLRSSGPVHSEVFQANRPLARPLMVAPRVRIQPERPPLNLFRPPVTVAPPFSHPRPVHSAPVTTGTATVMKPAAPATSATAAPPTAPVTAAEGFVIDKTPSAVPPTEKTEQLPEEMREYMQKMEEQRKKREEVLKMKEERRRKIAASESQDSSKGPTELPVKTKTQGVVNPIQTIQNGQVVPAAPAQAVPSTDSQNLANRAKLPFRTGVNQPAPTAPARKTLLVKPTPTVTNTSVSPIIGSSGPSTATNPPAAAPATSGAGTTGSKRRFKIIIIKNKNGDVLEKRYVPIESDVGSGSGPSGATAANRLVISRPTDRASQTVAIENLNPNSTEKDVRNLCEYFGPVQEIYPKLQEGKAIVRFTSASAAEHFVHNHNTPGIYVQFV